MQLDQPTRSRIEDIINSDKVVLFMKGTRVQPQCGFSAATVGILDSLVGDYATFNVLEDQAVREGIKAFSSWPTIPQLFVDGEFMGGCDITKQMFNSGELHEVLGVEPPDRTPPEITMSEVAAEIIRGALEANPGVHVHLSIDARWQHGFQLAPAEGHEVRAEAGGIAVLMDVATAAKAKGMHIDAEDTLQGKAFRIENPNAPALVEQMEVAELKRRLDAGEPLNLIDVRPEDERERASIPGSMVMEGPQGVAAVAALGKDVPLVFYCHTGQRSQAAAEHFRLQGFEKVFNLAGGVDAWSQQVDPTIPRY